MWVAAVVATLAFVLASAGRAKLAGPSRRAQGAGELVLAAAALIAPVPVTGAALALVFAGFAVVHARSRAAGPDAAASCECFGVPVGMAAPAGARRLALTAGSALVVAAAAVVAVTSSARAPVALVAARPSAGVIVLVVAALAAWAWQAAFAGPAEGPTASDRVVAASAALLERRFSRRGLLVRLAAAGSALTVAPLRYLLYPVSAEAAISPDSCGSGLCTDGYTAFCCEINHGHNSCPTGTFTGGWWMCTDYPGRKLCSEQGVRFYVDCNALPGDHYPGGCHCANGNCGERRVNCNVFRYGQCNAQIEGVTAVVCRMVVCENPSAFSELNCSASVAVDDAVCDHEAPCLEPGIPVTVGGGV
jgi:hypothetical protein